MNIPSDMIDHVALERVVETHAMRGTCIVGQAGGWGIIIQYRIIERALAAKRGAMRIFRKFETLVTYLKKIGIVTCQIDASNVDPVSHKTEHYCLHASERMKNTHETAACKAWLVQQVEESMNDSSPSMAHSEVIVEWESERNALVKQQTERNRS